MVSFLLGLVPATDLFLFLLCATNPKTLIPHWVHSPMRHPWTQGGFVIHDFAQGSISDFG
jgi:hypothetical protein